MMRTLLFKTLYDKRWFILGWALIIAFNIVLTVIFYPSLNHGEALTKLSQSTPDQLKGLIDTSSFHAIQSYIAAQLYNLRIPLLLMALALILSQSLTVSEEEKGTLRTLTTIPHSRTRILWEKWLAGVAILTIMALVAAAAVYLGILRIHETLPFSFVWQVTLVLWLFGVTAFSIMYAIGAATGSRSVSLVVGLLIIMASVVISSFGASVDWLKDWQILSLIHYAQADNIVKSGGLDRLNLWLMGLFSAVAMLYAMVLFRRRDIS